MVEQFSSVYKTIDPSPNTAKNGAREERKIEKGHGDTVLYSQNSGGRNRGCRLVHGHYWLHGEASLGYMGSFLLKKKK